MTGMVGHDDDRGPLDPALDDRVLVERARTDPEAFALLYRRHLPDLHAFAYRRSGSREVAEDVTAVTFERALRNLGSFTWRDGGFRAWVFRIAANELADQHRAHRRSQSDRGLTAALRLAPAEDPDEFERAEARADAAGQGLLEALGRLRPRYQEAIGLRYLSGLSHAEAAAALGCSRPTMAVTLHRALGALRRELDR